MTKPASKKNNVEKTLRLLDVLKFIFCESTFKDKLVLKGGTAINLAYSKLKRLSVDIDLDYHGALDKETTNVDRVAILNELDMFMENNGYRISKTTRQSAILSSKVYAYSSELGYGDNIKIELNFIDRISLFPSKSVQINYFGKEVLVIVPQKEELFGMKLSALADRGKIRDLYDSLYLVKELELMDVDKLRKTAIFYLSLDYFLEIEEETLLANAKKLDKDDVKKELLPVISRSECFDINNALHDIAKCLAMVFQLTNNEKQYLIDFSKGTFNPFLLFDSDAATRAEKHPMAKWMIMNIQKK